MLLPEWYSKWMIEKVSADTRIEGLDAAPA